MVLFDASLKRLVIPEKTGILKTSRKRAALIKWAVRNDFGAIVLPFGYPGFIADEITSAGLNAEAGGWTISVMVPRKLFFFHRDLFRMDSGKRKRKIHFCPTNPGTIETIKSETRKLAKSASRINVFHLWPERGNESAWCSCPACRAFSPAEQNRIAVNAAADALAEENASAVVTWYEDSPEIFSADLNLTGNSEIKMRPNVFKIDPEKLTLFEESKFRFQQ